MFIGLPMIAGFVPFGWPFTNPSTSLFICPLCALLVFAINGLDLSWLDYPNENW